MTYKVAPFSIHANDACYLRLHMHATQLQNNFQDSTYPKYLWLHDTSMQCILPRIRVPM